MKLSLTMRKGCHLLYMLLLLFLVLTGPSLGCGTGRGGGRRRRPRKMTPLVFKQHVPNVSERNLGASGVAEGVITRESPKFKDLVVNSNRDIIFKDEEGTGADRLMTQRCKEKLNRLAISVMNTWPNVKLRVTEAWDEERNQHHAKDSLHYEGRAVDLTTSDRDRSKYGFLARLAVEAGFDWVYFMSRGHIHCSVKSESSITTQTGGCFPQQSMVTVESGKQTSMGQLQVGDRVLSMNDHGHLEYSEVLIFMDRDENKTSSFVSIETNTGRTIHLTSIHLIPVAESRATLPELMRPTFAGKVLVGHYVSVRDNNGVLIVSKVTKVTVTRQKGVFAPLTRSGTIIVDGVVASCYGVIESQTIAHAAFAPLRTAHYVSSYFRRKPSVTHMSQPQGIHWYAEFLYRLAPYILNKNIWFAS